MAGGSGVAVYGGVTASFALAALGFCVALGGFLVNWHYAHKRDKREQREHEARMAKLDFPEA